MASSLKNLSTYDDKTLPMADDFTFGIIVAEWNAAITHALYAGCLDTLMAHGAKEENIHVMQVPGSFELVPGAKIMAAQHNPEAVICLGCVIKGETQHDEYIAHAVAQGLTNLNILGGRSFVFGVITTNNEAQAHDRSGGKHGNKGVEAAITAIRMVGLKRGDKGEKKKIGF
jgi:6,7-dimethyl-8-ribityllumazine synthase